MLYSGWVGLLSIAWGVERPRMPPRPLAFLPAVMGPGGTCTPLPAWLPAGPTLHTKNGGPPGAPGTGGPGPTPRPLRAGPGRGPLRAPPPPPGFARRPGRVPGREALSPAPPLAGLPPGQKTGDARGILGRPAAPPQGVRAPGGIRPFPPARRFRPLRASRGGPPGRPLPRAIYPRRPRGPRRRGTIFSFIFSPLSTPRAPRRPEGGCSVVPAAAFRGRPRRDRGLPPPRGRRGRPGGRRPQLPGRPGAAGRPRQGAGSPPGAAPGAPSAPDAGKPRGAASRATLRVRVGAAARSDARTRGRLRLPSPSPSCRGPARVRPGPRSPWGAPPAGARPLRPHAAPPRRRGEAGALSPGGVRGSPWPLPGGRDQGTTGSAPAARPAACQGRPPAPPRCPHPPPPSGSQTAGKTTRGWSEDVPTGHPRATPLLSGPSPVSHRRGQATARKKTATAPAFMMASTPGAKSTAPRRKM